MKNTQDCTKCKTIQAFMKIQEGFFFFFLQKYRTFIKNTRTSILNMKKEKEDTKNSAIAPL